MNRISIPGGYQPRLNPAGTRLGYGNGVASVLTFGGPAASYGPYVPTGWTNDTHMGVTAYVGPAMRLVNVRNGEEYEVPVSEPAPICMTNDGAWWANTNGLFYRTGELVTHHATAGNLMGQVLDETGQFFTAELVNQGYATGVFDRTGKLHFVLDRKVAWGFTFNHAGSPLVFHTVNGRAMIDSINGRQVVPMQDGIADNRGALVVANGVLWAWTFAFLEGQPYAFGRPAHEQQGIRLEMPGGFMQARFDEGTQSFVVAAFNQDTGELVAYTDVSIETERREFTEGLTPPVHEPEPPIAEPPPVVVPPVTPPPPPVADCAQAEQRARAAELEAQEAHIQKAISNAAWITAKAEVVGLTQENARLRQENSALRSKPTPTLPPKPWYVPQATWDKILAAVSK